MKRYLFIAIALMGLLTSCEQAHKQLDSKDNMLISAPYVEPCLDWTVDYKALLNNMRDRGFVTTHIAPSRVEFAISREGRETETAAVLLDEEQAYIGAEVCVTDYTVTTAQVRRYLEQNYVFVKEVQTPTAEAYFHSKVLEDSILITYSVREAKPFIRYDKN